MQNRSTLIWLVTAINVGAALVTAICLVYLHGMQSQQTRIGPHASHGVLSNRVMPNPTVGHGAHPVFDCSMVRVPVGPPDEGFSDIETLSADRKKYANQPVAIRAIVVQSYQKIMGTNWFQFCDRPNGAVLVASGDQWVEPGSEVVVRGVLDIDRNIGTAYHFPLYIENARLEGSDVKSAPGEGPASVYDL